MYSCNVLVCSPRHIRFWKCSTGKKISSFLQNENFSNLKSDTNKHLLCASLCNSVALLFFLCPSRSAGPVTKLAHLFLSALFKKAASCQQKKLHFSNVTSVKRTINHCRSPCFVGPSLSFSFFFFLCPKLQRQPKLRIEEKPQECQTLNAQLYFFSLKMGAWLQILPTLFYQSFVTHDSPGSVLLYITVGNIFPLDPDLAQRIQNLALTIHFY